MKDNDNTLLSRRENKETGFMKTEDGGWSYIEMFVYVIEFCVVLYIDW